MRWGFAGLGLMGLPMATNLARAGIDLIAYNRSPGPLACLGRSGIRTCPNPAELFAACDAVILMLADDAAVDAVLGRGASDFSGRVSGKLIVNMGTHAPAWSKALEEDIIAAGGRFVEAPVSGSRGPAEAAQLIAMAAGKAESVADARTVLGFMCRDVVVTGEVPSAMACKMAVNLYLVVSVAALAETVALAKALDLDPALVAGVIGSGPLRSEVAIAKISKMVDEDFSPQAAIQDVCKNAALVADAADGAGVPVALLDSARIMFDEVLASGANKLDMAAVVTAIKPRKGPA